LNVGGLRESNSDPKNQHVKHFLTSTQAHVACLSEINPNWRHIPVNQRLPERTLGWWEAIHISTAHFATFETTESYQFGSISLWSLNYTAHGVKDTDRDSTGLGRWAWTRYRGREGVTLRIVTGYRPVLNKTGPLSVWNQHRGFPGQ
jgi:hypothetical protein